MSTKKKANSKPDMPLVDVFKQYEASEVVGAFIDWLKETEELQKASWDTVIQEDDKIQDFLHEFEFESNAKKRAVIATRLHTSRCTRREAKDTAKKLKPVTDFMREISNRNLSKLMRKMHGDLKAAEDFINSDREYKPRVKESSNGNNN